MRRGQKSKHHGCEKHRQAQGDTQSVEDAQATAAEEAVSPSSSSDVSPERSPIVHIPQEPQGVIPPTTVVKGDLGTGAAGGAEGQQEGVLSRSGAPLLARSSQEDPLAGQKGLLLWFLLNKYKMKEPVTKIEMLMSISRNYLPYFPVILKRTIDLLELVFGLDLRELDPRTQSFAVTSKLDITQEENMSEGGEFPKYGLMMPLLSMILVKGCRATEEDVWQFLNSLGVYDGSSHIIYGEPRKLITEDLVREQYLEYRQVPNSDPPRFEFLWGPKTYAERSKLKVLEFLAKAIVQPPSVFPWQ